MGFKFEKIIAMNIKDELTHEHSKVLTLRIVEYVKQDKIKFEELMQLFLGDDYRLCQRSSWAVNYCAEKHPELVKPYLKKIVNNLSNPNIHIAVKRNSVRMLQFIDVPQSLAGKLITQCFIFLNDVNEAIAVKAFSMTVIYNCGKNYPEIIEELAISIKNQMSLPSASAGIKAHSRKILLNIQKMELMAK